MKTPKILSEMKPIELMRASATMLLTMLLVWAPHAQAESLAARINDPAWDGRRVPENQQCEAYGGVNPMTPKIEITGIPQGTEAILMRFNDESFQQMRNGGHGVIGMRVEPGTTEATFPPVSGHTFELPEGVFMVRAHKGTRWGHKKGAYLPPCSGGRGNKYSVTVQASSIKNLEKKKFKKIARVKLNLGKY